MNKPQSYWEKRKARELYEELVKAEEAAEEMRQLYIASSREIQEEAVRLARRFQLRHNLSVKEADRLLNKALSPDNIEHLIQLLKQDPRNAAIAAELESQAYASRINRLGAVQESIDRVATEIYKQTNSATTTVLQDIGQSMYYKQIFEMQQRAGAAFGFTPLDPDRLMSIISRRWSGQNFSERLWANREQLVAEVKKQLLLGILTGRANRKMAQEIDGRFSVSYNNTRRLVRTEANYVANQLQVEAYKDTSVDRYIYVAILDLRTSEICRDLDKKRFLVSNAIVGENYPPMHPWCRSTTIAWMPDQLLKKLQQSAIDPATGEMITVPGDMTYQEWYDKYVRDNPRKGPAASSGRDIIPEHDPPRLLETIDVSNQNVVQETLEKYEEQIVNSEVENAIVISENGEVYQCFGNLNGVWPDADLGEKLRGAYVTHNHPLGSDNEYSFSKADYNLFMDYNLKELCGIDDRYIYRLSRFDKTIDSYPSLREAIEQEGYMQRHSEVIHDAMEDGVGYIRRRRKE